MTLGTHAVRVLNFRSVWRTWSGRTLCSWMSSAPPGTWRIFRTNSCSTTKKSRVSELDSALTSSTVIIKFAFSFRFWGCHGNVLKRELFVLVLKKRRTQSWWRSFQCVRENYYFFHLDRFLSSLFFKTVRNLKKKIQKGFQVCYLYTQSTSSFLNKKRWQVLLHHDLLGNVLYLWVSQY